MYYLAIGNRQALGGRYQVVAEMPLTVRDLQPELPVEPPAGLPAICRPYQRLNLFRWAVPEIHTCIVPQGGGEPVVLLGSGPLFADGSTWPALNLSWPRADYLQQLGWLIQLVRLWEPCLQEGVASSLLIPENIGVLGWQVRLYFLKADRQPPLLGELAQGWQQLMPLAPSLKNIVARTAAGQIATATDLLAALEAQAARSKPRQPPTVYGATHPGRRANNEDAFAHDPQGRYGIVCDGMGGHEGGEVASRLALESLEADIAPLVRGGYTPLQVRQGMAHALYRANQQILEINHGQGRTSSRQMGTTVVVYCLRGSLLHIAHVGDSRIYLIDRSHCQQLTVDDDVANLEVSLARTTSNAVLQMNGSGMLTQALGVIEMTSLQPSVQTFVLPEDCLVLLCSDGLCDDSLVERAWQSTLLPLLDMDLSSGAQVLIDLALQELGHDNITFVLLKYIA